jgi:flavin-dependent dehydrogenase
MAFKIYWRLLPEQHAELDRHVELALFPGGYAGLQPVEGGRANLCLLVQKSSFAAKYGSWENLLLAMKEACPHLRRRLEGAQCLFEKPLAISGLPYGYVAERSGEVWRLGDQAAVIPSFSGDGMSIALHSATRAAEYYLRGEDADCYQRVLSYELRTQVARATAVSKALVRAFGQRAAMALLGIIPSLLPLSAALTRIPVGALRKFGP